MYVISKIKKAQTNSNKKNPNSNKNLNKNSLQYRVDNMKEKIHSTTFFFAQQTYKCDQIWLYIIYHVQHVHEGKFLFVLKKMFGHTKIRSIHKREAS